MDFEFTYESEVITANDLCCELQVTLTAKVSSELNYARVRVWGVDDYEVTSIVKATGEDVTYMYQGKNDFVTEVDNEIEKQFDSIIEQNCSEREAANENRRYEHDV